MPFYFDQHGRAFRTEDGQPLRTKIVATIGSPTSYKKGIDDLYSPGSKGVTYCSLVEKFIRSGVDVIRLNLTHVKVEDVAEVYSEVKQAILSCEQKRITDKRIAVLADLPGPKIRFNFTKPVKVKVGMPFVVRFAARKGDQGNVVYVGREPLKKAMNEIDHRWPVLPVSGKPREIVENVLGVRGHREGQPRSTYDAMMRTIKDRLKSGDEVLVRIGDGEVVLRVDDGKFDPQKDDVHCTVITVKESPLIGKKGFTFKGIDLEVPSFTAEDRNKLDALLKSEYSGYGTRHWNPVLAFVALSFAQTANDVLRIKFHMRQTLAGLRKSAKKLEDHAAPAVVAKIESNKGWLNRHFILDVADGAMVARGDLGLQMEIENIPKIQKVLIQLCNKRGKPVITATEMLKSMTDSVEPTRAEGTDVFNAILDGSDAVMLSEETSKGRFPYHSIRKMIAIAVEAEMYAEWKRLEDPKQQSDAYLEKFNTFFVDTEQIIAANDERFKAIVRFLAVEPGGMLGTYFRNHSELPSYLALYQQKAHKSAMQLTTDRITQAACTMSETGEIKGILAATTSGRTARMIARMKPRMPVIGAAHDMLNTRKLIVSYGVWPICIGTVTDKEGPEGMFDRCTAEISKDDSLDTLLQNGEIIFTAGSRVAKPGSTNMIQIKTYGIEESPGPSKSRSTGRPPNGSAPKAATRSGARKRR